MQPKDHDDLGPNGRPEADHDEDEAIQRSKDDGNGQVFQLVMNVLDTLCRFAV